LGGTGIIGGNTTISNGARLEFSVSTLPGSHDKFELAAGKTLTFSGGSTLTITSSGGGAIGTYTLLTAPGGITGNAPTNVILPAGWSATVSVSGGTNLLLNVTAVPVTGYASWAGGATFIADSNNDRVPNGLAWVLGAATPSVRATGLLPVGDGTTDPDYYIYTYRRSDAAFADPQTSIVAQYGSDLAGWTNAVHDSTNIIITTADNFYATSPGVDKVEVKVKRILGANSRVFVRLRVTASP
jgi:hypothetical protein